jgi:hypothetical protein
MSHKFETEIRGNLGAVIGKTVCQGSPLWDEQCAVNHAEAAGKTKKESERYIDWERKGFPVTVWRGTEAEAQLRNKTRCFRMVAANYYYLWE